MSGPVSDGTAGGTAGGMTADASTGPQISIVIPVFNGEETLSRCLDAVTRQVGWKCGLDYEVVVVDDGSTDATAGIAAGYPVRLVRMAENSGRILAREKGARMAACGTILFVDSRVVVAADILEAQARIEGDMLIAGDLGEVRRAETNPVDKVFMLLRNRYYLGGYPQTVAVLEIGEANFDRSPKGLTCARIRKDLFLSFQPDDKSKSVNDDARLLHAIVKERGIPIKRCRALRIEYLQRSDRASLRPWLIHRGVMFVDFVLERNAAFQVALAASYLAVLVLVVLAFAAPSAFLVVAGSALLALLALCAYLSRSPRDVVLLMTTLPGLMFLFWFGVTKGLFIRMGRIGHAR